MTKRIALIGAGLIGRGWAAVFARAGHEVALHDATPGAVERAMAAIGTSLDDLEAAGLIPSAGTARARLRPAASLEEALDGAAFAQESVTENADVKRGVFMAMDRAAPSDAVLASSCSAIPGSVFLEAVPGRHRCLIAHPANPPHLMPVVELVPTPWTSAQATEACRVLMAEVGQIPVLVRKEVDGFVMNRLQAGVINEAVSLVARGVISPEDLDKVMRHSLGLRWSFMGPFETMDLNAPEGFADYAARYSGGYRTMGEQLRVADPWDDDAIAAIGAARRAALPPEDVTERHRWRDRRLMALLRHVRDSDETIGR